MQEHTITGEAVVLNLRAANFMPRLGAALLDAIVYLIGWGFLIYGLAEFTAVFGMDVAAVQTVMLLATILLTFIIPLLVEGFSHGRSLGKLAFGLRVVRDDGGTIRWRHAFARCLTGVFELWMTFGSIAVLASLFNKHSKRLGDMMAGSYVILLAGPRLPAPMPDVPPAYAAVGTGRRPRSYPAGLVAQINSLIRNSPTMHPTAPASVSQDVYARLLEYVTPGPRWS